MPDGSSTSDLSASPSPREELPQMSEPTLARRPAVTSRFLSYPFASPAPTGTLSFPFRAVPRR